MAPFGKMLMVFGAVLLMIGAIVMVGSKVPWFGRLPGDIMYQKKNFTFYFPLTTSILLSVVISCVFYLLRRR